MGVTGAILSVPVAAALSVVVDEIHRQRLRLDENGRSTSAEPDRVA
jgi:hypothetical protein